MGVHIFVDLIHNKKCKDDERSWVCPQSTSKYIYGNEYFYYPMTQEIYRREKLGVGIEVGNGMLDEVSYHIIRIFDQLLVYQRVN